ncbi:hypothetical protein BGW38_008037, partial [Lunasporangiospora selenospora]
SQPRHPGPAGASHAHSNSSTSIPLAASTLLSTAGHHHDDDTPAAARAPLKYSLKDIHPDDSKDKVFAAILKALLYLKNKPSSPKELANCIMKNKYTMLG